MSGERKRIDHIANRTSDIFLAAVEQKTMDDDLARHATLADIRNAGP